MKISSWLLAASLLSLSLSPAFASRPIAQERVEVAFVLDTTGSMADLIDGAKRKIWSIASSIVDTNPDADIAMALVAYRDRGDEYVVKTTPLSEDIQGLYGKLIKLEADGGDDTPESVNEALDKAVRGLQWTTGDNVRHIIFLVGDAPPHMDYPQERQYPTILRDAVARDIVVNAVQAGDMAETTPIWKEIAQFGHGRYIPIPQSGGPIVVIETPYDDEILRLQGELDETVVPYGSVEKRDGLARKMAEKSAAAPAVKIDNSSYYSKRAKVREVVTGEGDLIGDIRNNRVQLDAVAEKDLPKTLQDMPTDKRKVWVAGQIESRRVLDEKLAALIAKRDAYVATVKTKTARKDSFDAAVEETLKSQLN